MRRPYGSKDTYQYKLCGSINAYSKEKDLTPCWRALLYVLLATSSVHTYTHIHMHVNLNVKGVLRYLKLKAFEVL